jgi:hypothetical protein
MAVRTGRSSNFRGGEVRCRNLQSRRSYLPRRILKPEEIENMRKLRDRLTFANVVSVIALFVALGGASYAVFKLPKNSVGAKQLKKNAVTTAKIKKEAVTGAKVKKGSLTGANVAKGSLSGTQINASTLGTVPNAENAQTANALSQPEPWHVIGAPGEPNYTNSWHTVHGTAVQAVAFYKDHEGIVHLKGIAGGGTGLAMFNLPSGFLPASKKIDELTVGCGGPSGECNLHSVGALVVYGPGVGGDGLVQAPLGATVVNLEGITFRAES